MSKRYRKELRTCLKLKIMEQTLSQGNMRVEDPEQEGGRTLMK
jgi:hypothetical protein